jgi:hypothetical protein
MMKIKYLLGIVALIISVSMSAQDKLFTLEDLNFGGKNYANLRPQNMWLTWWGEKLIQTDVEECYTIDTRTGKKSLLFTLEDINKMAGSNDESYVRHLMNARFPYPDKPIVALGNRKAFILLDFETKNIVWQDSISGQEANDWNSVSRATAYVEDNQLYVVDGEGKKHQLSADGSRDIVSSCGTDGNEEKSYLQPEQLSKLIKENPNYKGQPVVLLVCNNGKDPNNDENSRDCYAQKLANALGENSMVIASEGYVDYKTGVMVQTRPNGREITCRTYSVDPGKQHLFRGVKK